MIDVGREHAVVVGHLLPPQRSSGRQALADVLEGAAEGPHLAIAQRRTDRLRRETGVVDAHDDRGDPIDAVRTQDPRRGIARTWTLTPLKMFPARRSQKFWSVNAALIIVGVLRGSARRVLMPWMLNTGSGTTTVSSRIAPAFRTHELPQVHALGGDDVVEASQHRRGPVGGIGQHVQREVRRLQLMVRTAQIDRRVGVVLAAGVHLVDGTRIGAAAEVARRAGLHAVAADLHVPEEGLPQRNGDIAVPDVGPEVRRLGNRNLLQRSRTWVVVRKQFLRQVAGTLARRLWGGERCGGIHGHGTCHEQANQGDGERPPDQVAFHFHDQLLCGREDRAAPDRARRGRRGPASGSAATRRFIPDLRRAVPDEAAFSRDALDPRVNFGNDW